MSVPALRARIAGTAHHARAAHPARASGTALLLPVALLAGCFYTQPKHSPNADLLRIGQLLPGHYTDARSGHGAGGSPIPPAHMELAVVPIDSLMLGKPAFFLRLSDPARPGRPLEQRIVAFNELGGQVVETQWLLTDPPRWRDGAESPELFTSLQPPDVKPLRGCSLVWRREQDRLIGTGDADKCPAGAVQDPLAPLASLHVELTAGALVFGEAPPAAGASAPAGEAGVVRLRRRAED